MPDVTNEAQRAVFVDFDGGGKAYGHVGSIPKAPRTLTTITLVAPPAWPNRAIHERPTEGEVLGLDAASGVVFRDAVPVGRVTKTALDALRARIGLKAVPRPAKTKGRKRVDPGTGEKITPDPIAGTIARRGPTLGWASDPSGPGSRVETNIRKGR